MGIEPTYSAWKADALPLNYTRVCPRRGYAKGDDAAGLSRLSGKNIVIKMERFALIGFLPFPVHARFGAYRAAERPIDIRRRYEKRKTICIRPRRLVHRCGLYIPAPRQQGG